LHEYELGIRADDLGVQKRFGAVTVPGGVRQSSGPGEIPALMGWNGVGKSTVAKWWPAVCQPDADEIRVSAKRARISCPADPGACSLNPIYEALSVAPNVGMDGFGDEIAEAGAQAGLDERFLLRVDAPAFIGMPKLNLVDGGIDAQGRLAASGAVHVFGANGARIDSKQPARAGDQFNSILEAT
jgi:energy-coupling factor transporter ATP-binding protein EcfA2